MKKRIISLCLALVTVLSLSIPTMAAEEEQTWPNYTLGDPSWCVYAMDAVEGEKVTIPEIRISEYSDPVTTVTTLNVTSDGRFQMAGLSGACRYPTFCKVNFDAAGQTLAVVSEFEMGSEWYDDYGDPSNCVMADIVKAGQVQAGETFGFPYGGTFYILNVAGSAAPAAAPAAPAAVGDYTVRQYDTWGLLALNNYGTYGVWKQLMNANKGVKLAKGAAVTLPATLGKTARIAAPVAADGEQLYIVQAGDTLGKIAQTTYGKISLYKNIFERNADRLKNANTIYEGQIIVLPAAPAETAPQQ